MGIGITGSQITQGPMLTLWHSSIHNHERDVMSGAIPLRDIITGHLHVVYEVMPCTKSTHQYGTTYFDNFSTFA